MLLVQLSGPAPFTAKRTHAPRRTHGGKNLNAMEHGALTYGSSSPRGPKAQVNQLEAKSAPLRRRASKKATSVSNVPEKRPHDHCKEPETVDWNWNRVPLYPQTGSANKESCLSATERNWKRRALADLQPCGAQQSRCHSNRPGAKLRSTCDAQVWLRHICKSPLRPPTENLPYILTKNK